MKYCLPLFLTLLVSCQPQSPSRNKASLMDLPEPEQGEVWTKENEAQAEMILDQTKDIVAKNAAENKVYNRDAHPKAHGCVKAYFSVNSAQLPQDMRTGVFKEDKKYEAWIRFSNGSPSGTKAHDLEKDVRGMAVKLMNVPESSSGSQDFVMITSKEFFSKDGNDYMALFNALTSGSKLALARYGVMHPRSALHLAKARVQISSPLETNFYSSTIYKLGKSTMRFKAEPCSQLKSDLPAANSSPNYLRERLVKTLEQQEQCFNFSIQKNTGNWNVEDPRDEWNESVSPYHLAGKIIIPKQTGVSSAAQMNFCENLSFDPWHTRAETRPIGQINRMRALIYHEVSKMRHDGNRTTVMEPKDHNPCQGPTSVLCADPRH